MQHVYVREANREVLIYLDRNMGDRLVALKEAARLLQLEVIYEQTRTNRNSIGSNDGNVISPG